MAATLALSLATALLIVLGGGIFPGALTVCGLGLGCVLLVQHVLRPTPTLAPQRWLPRVTLLAVLILGVVYILPSPFTGSSIRATHNQTVTDTLDELHGQPATPPARFSLSRNRAGSMRQLMLGVTLLFATVLSGTCSLANRRKLLIILLVAATVTAAAGYLSQHIYPQGKTLWWTTPVLHGKPVGCFINRNHFGGFIALFAPIVLLLGIDTLSKKQLFRAALCVLAVCVMTWAIIFSQSRGAWVAFGDGCAYLGRRLSRMTPLSYPPVTALAEAACRREGRSREGRARLRRGGKKAAARPPLVAYALCYCAGEGGRTFAS